MDNRFRDKVVLITGAGGGIGHEIVRLFAREGALLALADRDAGALSGVREIAEVIGQPHVLLPGDLEDGSYCDALPRTAHAWNGRLDILINNAGMMRRGNILDTSNEDWNCVMKVNVESVFRICRTAISIMKQQGGGCIVNTASCWGLYPGPDHVAYCTSKAAVAAMTRCLGRDHAADGIRINAVCPNEVNTPMLRTGFSIRGLDPETAVEQLNRTVPIGRIAGAEEIASVIGFLASDQSGYMCGSLVEVNGGKPVY